MGPTASGKTALAVKIAERFNGEVISADSMQVYRGLDIGTAKPDLEERHNIPHHLIDIMDIGESLEVFSFVELADRKIEEIRSRGKLPVIAGGTGFYLKALLYGLDPLPADPEIRAELDRKYDSNEGHELLKKFMAEHDPVDLERWHDNRRKLIRACEIFKITGKPITELQTINKPKLRFPVASLFLNWDREILKDRIRKRTVLMLENGWIEETKKAIAAGLLESPTARQAIGYNLIGQYLDGKMDYNALIERIATSTWQYARRQLTWFRGQHPEAREVMMPYDEELLLKELSDKIKA